MSSCSPVVLLSCCPTLPSSRSPVILLFCHPALLRLALPSSHSPIIPLSCRPALPSSHSLLTVFGAAAVAAVGESSKCSFSGTALCRSPNAYYSPLGFIGTDCLWRRRTSFATKTCVCRRRQSLSPQNELLRRKLSALFCSSRRSSSSQRRRM